MQAIAAKRKNNPLQCSQVNKKLPNKGPMAGDKTVILPIQDKVLSACSLFINS
jgi:hypothetical protein